MNNDKLTLSNLNRRAKAKTPPFWKKVRNIALMVGAVAGGVLTLPISLPAAIITAATVVASVAGTAATVAEFTISGPENASDDTAS